MSNRSIHRRRFLELVGLSLAAGGLLAACGGAASASIAPSAASSASAKASGATSTAPASARPSAPASAGPSAASAIPTIPAGQPESINIGTGVPVASFTPIWLGVDEGYFKQHGLNVSLKQLEGVTQAQAIVAGEVQIGSVGQAEVLDSRVGGADLIVIRQTTEYPVFELHAPPATNNLDDLKGKTIAITRAGSTTDIATRALLVKHGLKPDQDVKLLAANNPAGILAAMQTGQVQAGMLAPPGTFKADQAGFPKLVSLIDEKIPLALGSIVTTKKYGDEHPEVVYAFLEAESEGVRDFFNNPSLAISTIAKYTKSDQKTSQESYNVYKPAIEPVGLVTSGGFKTVQKYGKNTKTRQVNVADAYDNHFMQALQASGFIKGLGVKSS